MNFLSRHRIAAVLASAAALCLGACTTIETSVQPRLKQIKRAGAEIAASKTFVIDSDWRCGDIVMRKGASITFTPDGRGAFSCVLYTENPAGNQLRFASVQYHADGNILFIFPYGEATFLNMPRPRQDYPYDMALGFDHRHYEQIRSVRFLGSARRAPVQARR
jgi:hypothetical protein